ncbi:MAG: PaaX family transcriptional regulator C-terminal domain-containing protein [Ilumatobacteraceae bacterium]|nr:PaaX family transcriptional regulator C-terminal domain-containing protein [Ilumatobacteraceae bacterium]
MSKVRNSRRAAAPSSGALRPLNARSVALSILLGSHPPELPSRAFVAMAELFGISGGTMRTALSRMVAVGDVTSNDGRYRLAGRQVDRQDAQDIGRRAPSATWDGRWHTIVAVDDQRDLAERRRFRATMANRRYGELRPDIWIRPSNLGDAPTDPNWLVTTGTIDGIAPTALVGRLWDLDTIAAEAHRLLAEMADRRTRFDWDDDTSIPALFTTSAAVVRFLRHEPLLPDALTPHDWSVATLRSTYDEFETDHQRLLRRFLRHA